MHRVFRLLHLLDGGEGLVVLARELALEEGEDADLAVGEGEGDEGGGVGGEGDAGGGGFVLGRS